MKANDIIKPVEIKYIVWLVKLLYPHSYRYGLRGKIERFIELLKIIREHKAETNFRILRRSDGFSPLYQISHQKKKGGGRREIQAPIEELKLIQRLINKNILTDLSFSDFNNCGCSHGGVVDALTPHLNSQVILCVDIVAAFDSIEYSQILDIFKKFYYKKTAKMLAEITTYRNTLPQGAPTSPRLFEQACRNLHKILFRLAKKHNGVYSCYTDNLFFSLPNQEFPIELKEQIKSRIKNCGFSYHKLRIRKLDAQPFRALGLNIINGQFYNTRAYKRRIRKAIHHVKRLYELGLDIEEALNYLAGLMGFAINFPQKLLRDYEDLRGKDGSNEFKANL